MEIRHLNKYEVKILVESENSKKAREVIESLGFKAYEINKFDSLRTLNQNSALHKWFEMIEEEAANQGATMDMLVKNPQEVPITRSLLKDMFRLIGNTMYHKDSTAKLTKEEINEVIKVFDRVVSERLGIDIPFPSIENII